MPLSAADLLRAFDALAAEFARRGEHAQIAVIGGAAMVLLYEARETKDVNAYFFRPDAAIVREAVAEVAAELNLPKDWMNDDASRYFLGLTLGAPLYDSPSLEVRALTTLQLLAMKLAAWRDEVDRSDAALLIQDTDLSKTEIWRLIKSQIPADDLQKASDAFDDLWESVHGSA